MNRTERGSSNVMKSRTRSSNGRKGARSRSRVATAVSAGVGTIGRRVGALGRSMGATGRGGIGATSRRGRGTGTLAGMAASRRRRRAVAAVAGAAAVSRRRGRASLAVRMEKRPVGRPAHLPIDNYGTLSIPEIRSRLAGLKKADLRKVMNFERRHRGRQTIISHIERRLKAA